MNSAVRLPWTGEPQTGPVPGPTDFGKLTWIARLIASEWLLNDSRLVSLPNTDGTLRLFLLSRLSWRPSCVTTSGGYSYHYHDIGIKMTPTQTAAMISTGDVGPIL